MPRAKCLKFGLLNAGSLGTKQDEFRIAMSEHLVDIMAINETWLRQSEEGRAPSVPGYRLKHVPRSTSVRGGRGGGVGFYIKTGVRARVMQHPEQVDAEQMWLSVNMNGKRILVGTAYRPPWFDLSQFLDSITDSVTALAPYDNIILLGDFNVNLLNKDHKAATLNDFINYTQMNQVVQTPTHFVGESSTLIDIVCTDIKMRSVVVNHISELGNHSFIVCEAVIKKEKAKPRSVTYRPVKDILVDQFTADLESIPWLEMSRSNDVNSIVTHFANATTQLFDLHAPIRTKWFKDPPTPWITDNIKLMFKLRDEARGKYNKLKKNTSDEEKLKTARKYYIDLKNQAIFSLAREKDTYFSRDINKNIKNPKLLWRHLKTHVLPDHKDSLLPGHFDDPNNINRAFLDVPGSCSVSISQLTFFEYNRYLDVKSQFMLSCVSQAEVFRILRDLGTNAAGNDGLNLDMLNLTLPYTLQIITSIVNTSIETNTFPDAWKCAVVRPLPKVSNPNSFKDLRPISILPCLSKVLERVVYNQTLKYLEDSNILPDLQSGFRKGRGTATALADVIGNILEARDRGEGTILALLDFSRAFDAINTTLLLSKMAYYGFAAETIKWFASYLENRSQYVEIQKVDGTVLSSSPLPVSRGVPQGSILGPLLYILYSADIVESFKHCKYHMYADDLQIYISCRPPDVLIAVQKINQDLQNVAIWADQNSLVLNPLKSKYMILGSKKSISAMLSAEPIIVIKGDNIEQVNTATNLGLTMDPELRFEKHIVNCMRNCFYRLKMLYTFRKHLSVVLRKQLVDSLVLSRLNYCDTVYGPCLLARTNSLIQRIQNACIRYCVDIPRRSHVTPFANQNNILKMEARRRLHLAGLLFGVITTHKPRYLYEKLSWRQHLSKNHIRTTTNPLSIPQHRTAAFRGSFKYAASHCWNNLPPPLRGLKTKCNFLIHLKKYLLNIQNSS